MFIRKLALPFAALLLWGLSIAAHAQPTISHCTQDNPPLGQTQTCYLYETDANGNFSEISSLIINVFGFDWETGNLLIVEGINDSQPGTPSDIVVFTEGTGQLFSGGTPQFDQLLAAGIFSLGTFVEGALPNEEVVFLQNDSDTIHILSGVPPDQAPEPATLLLMAAGLAGLRVMRRKIA